jgi:hypothetical protein
MALLSQMFRTAAITGRTDTVNAWFADRQGGRWAEQKVQAAFPNLPPYGPKPPDRAEALRQLTELHERGVITDAEYERLRG